MTFHEVRTLKKRLINYIYPELNLYTKENAPYWLSYNLGVDQSALGAAFADVLRTWGIEKYEEMNGTTIADVMMGRFSGGGPIHAVRVVMSMMMIRHLYVIHGTR